MPNSTRESVAVLTSIIIFIALIGAFSTGHLPFYSTDSEDRGVVSEAQAQSMSQNNMELEAKMVLDSVGSLPAGLAESEPTFKSIIDVVVTTPAPQKPSELVNIVAYIAQVFEPEGKDVVVQAINCFYSESGLREDAVGQNSDAVKSTDHGVAQLNAYWHNLTEEEKTEYKANIDRAYKIYKGRGGNFSAWYGKRCN